MEFKRIMLDRRQILSGGLGLSAGLAAAAAGTRPANARAGLEQAAAPNEIPAFPLRNENQTAGLQKAIDEAAAAGKVLHLPAGTHITGPLSLPANCQISGVPGSTFLEFRGGACITAENVANIRLQGLVLDGRGLPLSEGPSDALLSLINVDQAVIRDCRFQNSGNTGISLHGSSAKITDNEIMVAANAGIFAQDSTGLEISHNYVHDCGNNGIQVWRSSKGSDNSIIALNRIERIRADAGGSGQNGNGVNIYRADGVSVSSNMITDCAYSAVRSNAGSDCQIIGNNCARIGEVALYAEFEFEGALVANNIIDDAASGIAITNFNKGGRLAVVQGNLIRNLYTRDHYDARGVGISAEADTLITGNTIENAPVAGLVLGWGDYLRDVSAANNLIRGAKIGIGISVSEGAGTAAVTGNMISGTEEGAIRGMNHTEPTGQDLTSADKYVTPTLTVSGNIAV